MFLETLPLFWLYTLTIIFGLIIGSFLNVVIYRLPKMMKQEWEHECQSYLDEIGQSHVLPKQDINRFNLITPASHCPRCNTPIRYRDNIPVLSWLLLKGRCHSCHYAISPQYPCVEILAAIVSFCVVQRFGVTLYALSLLGFSYTLIVLAVIDKNTLLLPDCVTLPLMWGGIFVSFIHISPIPLSASIGGVIGGYFILWSMFWVFKIITKRDGLGYGDFKLLAALGAWLGFQSLLFIIFVASILGSVVGSTLIKLKGKQEDNPVFAFGPYLALSAWIYLLYGNELILFYHQTLFGIN